MKQRYKKPAKSSFERLKLGFKRVLRTWIPIRRNQVRKQLLHDRRMDHVYPNIINVLLIGIFILFLLIDWADNRFFTSNPIITGSLIIFVFILFLLECWFAGSNHYLDIRE